jgi:hypothetical protein
LRDMEEKALDNISKKLGEDKARECRACFDVVSDFPGASKVFKRIATARDKEDIEDYLAEVRYALIFNGLKFTVSFDPSLNPPSNKVPDLEIFRDDSKALVEVKHFRGVPSDLKVESMTDNDLLLEPCGDSLKLIDKLHDRFADAMAQVGDDASIVAIWNDDDRIDDLEVGQFSDGVADNFKSGRYKRPDSLLFVVYGSRVVNISRGLSWLICYPVKEQLEEPYKDWIKDLKGA